MKFKETKAIYLQIADRLCDEIVQGVYGPEERVPSVREYAALLEVNINTLMRSYEQLQMQGIIYTKRGLGYFVSPEAEETIRRLRREQFLGEDLPECFRMARMLGISADEIKQRYLEWEALQQSNESISKN